MSKVSQGSIEKSKEVRWVTGEEKIFNPFDRIVEYEGSKGIEIQI